MDDSADDEDASVDGSDEEEEGKDWEARGATGFRVSVPLTQCKQELEEEAKRADKRAFDEEPEPEVKKKGGGGPLAKKSRH